MESAAIVSFIFFIFWLLSIQTPKEVKPKEVKPKTIKEMREIAKNQQKAIKKELEQLGNNDDEYKKKYYEYLKSLKWEEKKNKVKERDNYTCQQCKNNNNLDVHHLTYKHIFKEPLIDLITVCRNCHDKIHKYHGKNAGYYPLLKKV